MRRLPRLMMGNRPWRWIRWRREIVVSCSPDMNRNLPMEPAILVLLGQRNMDVHMLHERLETRYALGAVKRRLRVMCAQDKIHIHRFKRNSDGPAIAIFALGPLGDRPPAMRPKKFSTAVKWLCCL